MFRNLLKSILIVNHQEYSRNEEGQQICLVQIPIQYLIRPQVFTNLPTSTHPESKSQNIIK